MSLDDSSGHFPLYFNNSCSMSAVTDWNTASKRISQEHSSGWRRDHRRKHSTWMLWRRALGCSAIYLTTANIQRILCKATSPTYSVLCPTSTNFSSTQIHKPLRDSANFLPPNCQDDSRYWIIENLLKCCCNELRSICVIHSDQFSKIEHFDYSHCTKIHQFCLITVRWIPNQL